MEVSKISIKVRSHLFLFLVFFRNGKRHRSLDWVSEAPKMTSVLVLDTGYGVAFYGRSWLVSITNQKEGRDAKEPKCKS